MNKKNCSSLSVPPIFAPIGLTAPAIFSGRLDRGCGRQKIRWRRGPVTHKLRRAPTQSIFPRSANQVRNGRRCCRPPRGCSRSIPELPEWYQGWACDRAAVKLVLDIPLIRKPSKFSDSVHHRIGAAFQNNAGIWSHGLVIDQAIVISPFKGRLAIGSASIVYDKREFSGFPSRAASLTSIVSPRGRPPA